MSSAVTGLAPKRLGNRSRNAAPQGVYPCTGTDEWVALTVETGEQWRALAALIGGDDLVNDDRFASIAGRMRHHDELDRIIGAWTGGRSTLDAEQMLQAAGVPAERMRRVADFVGAPDSGAAYRPIPGEQAQPVLACSLPFRFSRSTVATAGRPCLLGEHTNEVLADWLGLDDAEIDVLERRGGLA